MSEFAVSLVGTLMPQLESWLKLYSSKRLDFRLRAASGILEHSDVAPLDLLLDILTTLAHQGLGAKVEQVLLQRKDASLVSKMIGLLDSHDSFVRECACKVLGHSGDFSATPHLLRILDDPKMMVRRAAGFGLAFLKDKSSITELRQQLHRHRDDDFNVISAIQCALQTLGDEITLLNDEFSIKSDSTDPISLYKSRVYERLSEHREGFPPKESAARTTEAFLLPAFHPEAMIQVSFDGQGTVLRVATMTSSLWFYEQGSNYQQPNSTDSLRDPPELIEEVCYIGFDVAGEFWSTIDDLVAKGVKSTCNLGLDGISVRVVHRQGESKAAFEAWSPAKASPQGVFVGKLFDLAWNAVNDEKMMQRLEQIYGYLRGDLPVRWIENEIKTLRFFGSLTSHDEDGLLSLFASLPKDEPLVLDLINVEGMGTILYPTIRGFASQHDQLAWACSAAAVKHLQQMEIDSRSIFESVGQAVEYIRSQMQKFE